ncbi:MAG: Ppx/GppA family phosphatase [Candidatus Marinimicrobia bacterium]|nr:Ppx/GppA family phosphatase [Candidatus Neomarinimicrobiota bacterium]
MTGPVAAIDLGTNTCLLLVAVRDGPRLVPLAEELRVVRLGAGVERTGRLAETAMNRAEEVFREYRRIIESFECQQVRCVATSAFREASNGYELRRRIRAATGYDLTAITGQEEAHWVLRAVQEALPQGVGRRIIVDVGGGSTEIIMEDGGQLGAVESLRMGSVRLTERWLHHDPPLPEELKAVQADIDGVLTRSALRRDVDTLVGVGGTATTFVAMDLQLSTYDHRQVHGANLTRATLELSLHRCGALPYAERVKLPGLHPGRADIILAGGLILMGLMDHFHRQELVVSDRGLRWGVLGEMLASPEGQA